MSNEKYNFENPGRVGKRVLYMLTEMDVRDIIKSRQVAGYATAHGNDPREGQIVPGIVVADWGGSANLQVFLDGIDSYWPTSRTLFDPEGSTDYERELAVKGEYTPEPKGKWIFLED